MFKCQGIFSDWALLPVDIVQGNLAVKSLAFSGNEETEYWHEMGRYNNPLRTNSQNGQRR